MLGYIIADFRTGVLFIMIRTDKNKRGIGCGCALPEGVKSKENKSLNYCTDMVQYGIIFENNILNENIFGV